MIDMWIHSSSAYFLYRALLVRMRDMMAQQNLFYEEMLSRQEANFMSFKKNDLGINNQKKWWHHKRGRRGHILPSIPSGSQRWRRNLSYFNPNYCTFLLSAWKQRQPKVITEEISNVESLNNKLNSAPKATTAEMWHSRSKTNCGESLEIKGQRLFLPRWKHTSGMLIREKEERELFWQWNQPGNKERML